MGARTVTPQRIDTERRSGVFSHNRNLPNDVGDRTITGLYLKVHLLTQPDRQIRPLSLLGLASVFWRPFCHRDKVTVDAVDGAALTESAMESVGFRDVLLHAGADVAE